MNLKRLLSLLLTAIMLSVVSFGHVLALETTDTKPRPELFKDEKERLEKKREALRDVRGNLKVIPFGNAYYLETKWGDLKNRLGTDVDTTDWSGSIEVVNAKMGIKELILFDRNDEIVKDETDRSKVTWKSQIGSHYDGILLKLMVEPGIKTSEVKIMFKNTTASNFEVTLEELLGVARETIVEGDYGVHMRAKNAVSKKRPLPRNNPHILKVRWGDLDNTRDENEPQVKYDGAVTANGGRLHIIQPVLFESNDKILVDKGSEVNWESNIAGHYDGVLIKMLPATQDVGIDMDATKDRSITVTLGDFSKTITDPSQFGRYEIGDGYQVEIMNQFRLLEGFKQKDIDESFERKISLLEKGEMVEKQIDALKRANKFVNKRIEKLETLKQKIEGYNFDETTNEEARKALEALAKKLQRDDLSDFELRVSAEELEAKFEKLKGQAKKIKFVRGHIPFRDTDDDAWFTQYVDFVKKRDVVAGYVDENGNPLGEYRPGNNVNKAEMLKIALRSAGHDEKTATGFSKNSRAAKIWANKYFKKAEELGLTATVDGEDDPGRKITRAEVVRLVLESFGIDPEDVTSVDFDDVAADHPHARFIQFAKLKGIVSGAGDSGKFDPDKPINRAEVAKIMRLAIELFGGVDEI